MQATHVAYNRMLEQGSGAIYNMEGLGSDGRRITGLTPYGTSKRAVRYFSDAFAAEVKKGPVIVGTISPGMVLTDLTMTQVRKAPENNRQLIKIYNILANEADTVAPFLVRKMIDQHRRTEPRSRGSQRERSYAGSSSPPSPAGISSASIFNFQASSCRARG